MTKQAYIDAVRAALVAKNYPWLAQPSRRYPELSGLDGMLRLLREMLDTDRNLITIEGSLVEAWRAIGGKGKPTYKALRALPAE